MRSNLFWLNDEQWTAVQPFLPTDVRGKERVDDRRVIGGIVHVIKSGCRWCDCPPEYGPAKTIYNRFVRWAGGFYSWLMRARSRRSRSYEELGATVRASFLPATGPMEPGGCGATCWQKGHLAACTGSSV